MAQRDTIFHLWVARICNTLKNTLGQRAASYTLYNKTKVKHLKMAHVTYVMLECIFARSVRQTTNRLVPSVVKIM